MVKLDKKNCYFSWLYSHFQSKNNGIDFMIIKGKRAAVVISSSKNVFLSFGLSSDIFLDNGPPFESFKYQKFSDKYRINLKYFFFFLPVLLKVRFVHSIYFLVIPIYSVLYFYLLCSSPSNILLVLCVLFLIIPS